MAQWIPYIGPSHTQYLHQPPPPPPDWCLQSPVTMATTTFGTCLFCGDLARSHYLIIPGMCREFWRLAPGRERERVPRLEGGGGRLSQDHCVPRSPWFRDMVISSRSHFVPRWHSQKKRDARPMLVQCWATVCDAGPTLKQHWVSTAISCVDVDRHEMISL